MRKDKKHKKLYNPVVMTEELQKLGESYDKKEASLYYGAVLLIALLLGFFFHLKPVFMVILVVVYLLFVPWLFYNQKKRNFELRRFRDVNAYMSQMAQSFTSTKNVLKSLRETGNTFPNGQMSEVISKAIVHIEQAGLNLREAEREALRIIEADYNCEKLRNLHDFLLRAEERGGECNTEFKILEKLRMTWESVLHRYYLNLKLTRNLATITFALLIGVCIFLLDKFPERFSITYVPLTQVANLGILISFLVIFYFLDRQLNTSLLREGKQMSKERAETAFGYIQGFDAKKERKKYLGFSFALLMVIITIFVLKRNVVFLVFGMAIFILSLNIHRIILLLNIKEIKSEIKKAFPKWLFDVMLLMQSESVEVAIFKSVENAPPVLQGELNRISNLLAAEPRNADAYMSFLADFNVEGVETSMRKLYSLSVGTGGSSEVLNVLIDTNMDSLAQSEKNSIDTKGSLSSIYVYTPVLPITIGMMMYGVALLAKIISEIMALI